jgi:hypothetical protein
MDSMLGENKNLKDTIKDSERKSLTSYRAGIQNDSIALPYNKTDKLITALYMVTDTMDKEEPVRLKLRTLGIEILSDITSSQAISKTSFDIQKVDQILFFLNIASDVGMISEMNLNILRKEFIELKQSILEFRTKNQLWLEEFITRPSEINSSIGHSQSSSLSLNKGQGLSVQTGTRIGVQKGSTLMKALNKVSDKSNNFEIVKNQRREAIIKIIKDKPNGASIKDIIFSVRGLGDETGEKTIQRELVSMVKDNVLKKTGEKRWSLYFIN